MSDSLFMQIQRTQCEDVTVLAVDGRLDATTAPAFESALMAELAAGVARMVVDLGQVQLISSAALRVLVSAAKQAKKQEGQILLCALTPEVAKVFGISGLSSLFNLQPTRDDALAALGVAAAEPPPVAPEPPPTPDEASVELSEASTLTHASEPAPPPPAPVPIPEEAPTVMPVARVMPPPPVMPLPPVAAPPPVWVPPPTVAPPRPRPTPEGWLGQGRLMWIGTGALALFAVLVASLLFSHGSKSRPRVALPHVAATPTATVASDATPAATAEPPPPVATTTHPPPTATTPPIEGPADSATATVSVPPADAHRFDTQSTENQETRQAVLRRIDAMPILPAQRDRLYQELDRAHGLGKIITVRFGVGRSDLNGPAVEDLKAALRQSDLKTLLDDPSTVFVVLGFADATGTAQANKETSQRRAEKTLTALRDQCGVVNVLHAIGMGSSGLIDQEHLGKNRVAEVWAVLP